MNIERKDYMKVIYHVDESPKWKLCLANVKNMLTYYQQNHEEYQIEVLANGEAVEQYLKDTEYCLDFEQLSSQGICFTACHNAMNAHHIELNDLLECIRVVDAGVVELVLRQSEGFAYIKP